MAGKAAVRRLAGASRERERSQPPFFAPSGLFPLVNRWYGRADKRSHQSAVRRFAFLMMYSPKAHPTVLIQNSTLTYLILTMFISMARIKRLKGLEKYVSGDYTLGILNKDGQRLSIRVEIPRKDRAGMVSFITGWMVYPNGQIQLTTPYGGQ